MAKEFFSVFPTLKVDKELYDLFTGIMVEKVAFNRDKTRLKIYVDSDHLIHKKYIYAMEKELTACVCRGTGVEVVISEHFSLSAQYTPETLIREYMDSLVIEMWHISPINGNFFRNAQMEFPDPDRVILKLENTQICKDVGGKIRDILEQILAERCGMPCRVDTDYCLEPKKRIRAVYEDFPAPGMNTVTVPVEHDEMPGENKEKGFQGRTGRGGRTGKNQKKSRWGDRERTGGFIRSDNPDVICGKEIEGEVIPISDIVGEIGLVTVRGKIQSNERRDIRNNKSILKFVITDFTDSIVCKIFAPTEEADNTMARLAPGRFVKVQGYTKQDTFEHEITITSPLGVMAIPSFVTKRQDHYERKRVELHLHTKMSDMDGVSECKDLVKRAYEWGMPAVAITDHGNIQAFPDANHLVQDLIADTNKKNAAEGKPPVDPQDFFKVIYGVECYLVDDLMKVVTFGRTEDDPAFAEGRAVYTVEEKDGERAEEEKEGIREENADKDNRSETGEGESGRAREDSTEKKARDKEDAVTAETGAETAGDAFLPAGKTPGKEAARPENYDVRHGSFVIFDIETTGFSADNDRIIEIGAVKYENGKQTGEFSEFINPEIPIPYRITQLTSITDDMVMSAGTIREILPRFVDFCEGFVLVGHNVQFDISFIRKNCRDLGLADYYTTMDTMDMARVLLPGHKSYNLDAVGKMLDVVNPHHHRAVDDAETTARIFDKLLKMFVERGAYTLGAINSMADNNPDVIRRKRPYHCVLLAKNVTGRVNLYRLVSASHLTYFYQKPKIPKSLLQKYREGLLVGSACVAGELYQALLDQRSEERIAEIVKFYDYLEIQPRDNNRFLVASDRYENIRSIEDVLNINRKIVQLGEQFHKIVVATGDVHFLDPEDEIYRTIIQNAVGMGADKEEAAPLYFHTTDEMMEEFSYLGAQKCEEVVITNTNRIADMVEAISPVRPDKCPPVIEDSDQQLRDICFRKAHSMYGDPLPKIVEDRLEKELGSIIKNGYSVMYIIAQKLVWKSNEDGYLVGSRGSVGSSFVATMAGITEVNPLRPHYYCEKCHYSDFDSDLVKSYAGRCGADMPDKTCPNCGAPLMKAGFDIPFETFLGFKGDKEPDIDLNFSGEYQAKAHAYTKVIFGHEQTFKAGTIATVADKTAYGYVLHYCEENNIDKRRCEKERLAAGCTGVRRSTGQHPGGIVVLPVGEEINTFTPVQHPANDMETPIITTHFDYHSIDHNLLKLDILGHDDPTIIRMLQDLTGIDPLTIRLDDPGVMKLFTSTESLGITSEQDGGIRVGTLGVPEFGTKFVMGMLESTKPTTVSELITISGLSHGTDVWLGNAEDLIKSGTCDLSTCIGCRDDIMTYLINKGLDPSESFKIMENVRKGKVAKGACKQWPEWSEDMKAHGVPDWYMGSCQKIKYMFPKGHAAAYVMMALRIAWFKVHKPLAYYAAYYSIRAKAFDYEIMAQGQQHLLDVIEQYNARKDPKGANPLSAAEQAQLDDMLVVREMYARGIDFIPIELGKAKARHFTIWGDKLMPSYTSIAGMGATAADSLEEACKHGDFLSKEEVRERGKISQTIIDKMSALGILGDLPDSNQFSLFDLGLQ